MENEQTLDRLREEACQWAKDHPNAPTIVGAFPCRSCWKCNPSHEWMKTDMETPYYCIWCDRIYFKGQDITILD